MAVSVTHVAHTHEGQAVEAYTGNGVVVLDLNNAFMPEVNYLQPSSARDIAAILLAAAAEAEAQR